MALITCKDCKKEFSTDAKRCPHCGARKPGMGFGKKLLIISVATLVLTSIISGGGSGGSGYKSSASVETQAYRECRTHIRAALHDPGSADFESNRVSAIGGEVYEVAVFLRAKNGFGAMRRMKFYCTVANLSSGWRLVSLKDIPL